MKQSTVTWIATWLRVWAVLFSLPGSVMGRETVYLCHDFSEVLQSWWDRNANESRKRLPFNRRAMAWKKYPRCQPPDFCYQLCTPKGVHNNSAIIHIHKGANRKLCRYKMVTKWLCFLTHLPLNKMTAKYRPAITSSAMFVNEPWFVTIIFFIEVRSFGIWYEEPSLV